MFDNLPHGFSINRLPDDILCRVFYHYAEEMKPLLQAPELPISLETVCSSLSVIVPAHILGNVCKSWHDIAHTLDESWTTLRIRSLSNPLQLQEALNRTAGLDTPTSIPTPHNLDITIVTNFGSSGTYHMLFDRILANHASRIKNLTIYGTYFSAAYMAYGIARLGEGGYDRITLQELPGFLKPELTQPWTYYSERWTCRSLVKSHLNNRWTRLPVSNSRCLIRAHKICLKQIRWTDLFLELFPPQSIVVECLTLDRIYEGYLSLRRILMKEIPCRFQKMPFLESFNNCTDDILAMGKLKVANEFFPIADCVIINKNEYITQPTECLYPDASTILPVEVSKEVYASTFPPIKVSKEARGPVQKTLAWLQRLLMRKDKYKS